MGKIFSADKIYFDEQSYGISSGINNDDGFNWNAQAGTGVDISVDTSLSDETYIASELLDIDTEVDITLDENYSDYVDLLKLVPNKFRSSVVLQEFLEECGLKVGGWLGYINDIEKLIDPYNVGDDYIQNLADLLGFTLNITDTTTIDEKRRQLLTAIDFYKKKGTYGALSYVAYLLNITMNIWDMYTNDYSTFVQEEWFTGKENENPPGLDSSYYKSPHIGLETVLNTVYGESPNKHLYLTSMVTDLSYYIEKVRPVNVVSHYSILLNPVCDESGSVTEVAGEIKSCVLGDWVFSRKFFDDSNYFDDGNFFDYTETSFLNSVTKWKLGTGNKEVSPDSSNFDLETVVASGDISSISIYIDRVEYEFTISGSTQQGISELGLYLNDGTTLVAASTFPDIDLSTSIELRVLFIIYV